MVIFQFYTQQGIIVKIIFIRLKPLQGWETSVKNGHIKRVTDADIQSAAIEIIGANVSNNFISHPIDSNISLGIKMPTVVMQIKSVF